MANNNHFELTLDTLAPTGSISGLGDYEKELENEGFCRIHRGYIVALGSIKSIKSREIYVEGDIALPISKSKEKLLKEKLFAYVKEEAI